MERFAALASAIIGEEALNRIGDEIVEFLVQASSQAAFLYFCIALKRTEWQRNCYVWQPRRGQVEAIAITKRHPMPEGVQERLSYADRGYGSRGRRRIFRRANGSGGA